MIAKRIRGATNRLSAPVGVSEEDVKPLWVRIDRDPAVGMIVESAWEPTPRELDLLNAGGAVILRVVGGQPPVALYVSPADEEAEADG